MKIPVIRSGSDFMCPIFIVKYPLVDLGTRWYQYLSSLSKEEAFVKRKALEK